MIISMESEPGRFAPLQADHPAVGEPCPGCGRPLQVGDVPALVNGVPDGAEELARAHAGQAHRLQCGIAHEACALAV